MCNLCYLLSIRLGLDWKATRGTRKKSDLPRGGGAMPTFSKNLKCAGLLVSWSFGWNSFSSRISKMLSLKKYFYLSNLKEFFIGHDLQRSVLVRFYFGDSSKMQNNLDCIWAHLTSNFTLVKFGKLGMVDGIARWLRLVFEPCCHRFESRSCWFFYSKEIFERSSVEGAAWQFTGRKWLVGSSGWWAQVAGGLKWLVGCAISVKVWVQIPPELFFIFLFFLKIYWWLNHCRSGIQIRLPQLVGGSTGPGFSLLDRKYFNLAKTTYLLSGTSAAI